MEKLMKSINSLKFYYGRSSITEKIDKDLEPKERQNHCNAIIDLLINSQAVKTVPEFQSLLGLSTEVLLQSCADENADVRLTANDCINTLVKTISSSNIHKILVELFKEIRKNSSSRSLKVALDRFSHLCVNIRPSKCRPFLLNLLPCLARVSSRDEDTIQECLNTSMKNIFRILGSFVNEHELQTLVVSFLKNLSCESQVKRRVAGSCLHVIVENSRNSFLFLRSLLCSIRDILLQRLNDRCTAIGCLHAFRQLTPLLATSEDVDNNDIEDDVFMVFSMALYFTTNTDHTIVTSSLELIDQIFTSYSWQMSRMLATHQPFKTKFNIYSAMKKVLTPNAGRKQKQTEENNNNKQEEDSNNGVQEETKQCLNDLLDRIVANLHEDSASDNLSIHSNLSYDMRDMNGGGFDVISLDHFFPNATRCNQENPLFLFAKLLCQKFLLTPIKGKMISSSEVRVSNKSLALNCLEHLVKIHPEYLLENLYGNQQQQQSSTGSNDVVVKLCDVTLYAQHVDPKLRGSAVKLMARFLKSSTNNRTNGDDMVENLQTDNIIQLIKSALKDESPITNRHACVAVTTCIDVLLDSDNHRQGLQVLTDLLHLLTNSNYWLLIVEILACISNLNFRRIHLLETYLGRSYRKIDALQPKVMEIVLGFLGNDDIRIRSAASTTLCALVSNLVTHDHSSVSVVAMEAIFQSKVVLSIHDREDVVDGDQLKSLLKPYRGYHVVDTGDLSYSSSLSIIIQSVWRMLATSTSKHLTSGCVQTLKSVAQQFPVNSYLSPWQCHFFTALPPPTGSFTQASQHARPGVQELRKLRKELQQLPGLLPYIFDLLKSSWVILDFNIHSDALLLAGDLLAAAVHAGHLSKISNPVLSRYAREMYTHLVKMLSVLHHVIIGVTPSLPNKGVLPNLTAQTSLKKQDSNLTSGVVTQKIISSPLQRSSSAKEDSDKDKSVKVGNFASNRNLMKLHSQLLGAYSGYKRNMNYGKDDKFCSFANVVLNVFNQLLEMTVFEDISENTDEILSYLASTFDVEPTFTIQCVHQLLKSLFGTNLVNQLQQDHGENPKQNTKNETDHSGSLYHQLFHHPIDRFTISIANSSFHNSLIITQPEKDGWFGSIKKKVEKKLQQVSKTTKNNKVSIQNYIRLFETIVIKSLKHYTSSNDTRLQTSVVDLLSQLVQLRVNYCMLDSDQVFIKFIIKQFESIENGLVRGSQHLIPHVFFFLVLLSYERYHTRCVITMPKIIQLCDGLNAGGQDALTHVIPALEPVIYDLFIFRTTSIRQNDLEISTQREVVQFTILKLLHYPQSFEMLACMLRHYRQEDNEKWKRFSRQVADVILPLLDQLKVEIDCEKHLQMLHSVMRLLSSSSLKPVELLLRIMFDIPQQLTCISLFRRWLSKFLILLRIVICQVDGVELYTSLPHIMPKIQAFTKDIQLPHGVLMSKLPSEVTSSMDVNIFLSRYFNHVTQMTAEVLLEVCNKFDKNSIRDDDDDDLLAQLLAELLLSFSYVHRSGKLKNLTETLRELDVDGNLQVFTKLVHFHPSLTLLWTQYLTGIGLVTMETWRIFTKCGVDEKELSMKEQICRNGSIILLTDFICRYKERGDLIEWLLRHHLRHLLELMDEPPVQDFLIQSLHENTESFIREVSRHFSTDDCDIGLVQRLVKVTTKCYSLQLFLLFTTGSNDFLFSPYLAISDVCDRKLCQIVEHQISLVNNKRARQQQQIDIVQLQCVLDKMGDGGEFPRLYSLLCKLKRLLINGTNKENDDVTIQPDIAAGNEEFFNSMLKLSCSGDSLSSQLATMMTYADDDVIKEIVNSKEFKLEFVHSCFDTRHIKPVLTISSVTEGGKRCLMKSATDLITRLVGEICDELPEGCEKQRYTTGKQNFGDEMTTIFGKWRHQVFVLCQCVGDVISTQVDGSAPPMTSYIRFAFIANEYLIWRLTSDDDMTTVARHHVTSLLNMTNLILNETDEMTKGNREFLRSLVESSFLVIQQYIGVLTSNFPCLPQQFDEVRTNMIFYDVTHPLSSCMKLAQLVEIFTFKQQIPLPLDVAHPMKTLVYQLSSYNLFESYIRIPRSVWKFGWNCELLEDNKFPDIPTDYLREVEVLGPYLTILNVIGWRNRTEFEEIWTKFLSILVSQPIHSYSSANSEQVDENSLEVSCLAIRAMTSLMMQCSLQPKVGRPSTCNFQIQHRNCSMKISGTRAGRQLTRVLDLLHDEMSILLDVDTQQIPKQKPPLQTLNSSSDLFYGNSELVMKTKSHYNFGQISLQHFRSIHGVLPVYPEDISETSSSDNVNLSTISLPTDEEDDDSDVSDVFEEQLKQQQQNNQVTPAAAVMTSRRGNDNDVDVQSCVQFLLDLFGEWIRTTTSSGLEPLTSGVTMATTARPFLAECLRSLSLISDLFTERRQFEWLFSTLSALYNTIYKDDDEILLQHIVSLLCKAASILGLKVEMIELLLSALERLLSGKFTSSKIVALHGFLYCLESGKNTDSIVSYLSNFLIVTFQSINISETANNVTTNNVTDEEFLVVSVSTAFYLIYNSKITVTSYFTSAVLQTCVNLVSTGNRTSTRLFQVIMNGFERMLVSYSLSSSFCQLIFKCALDNVLINPMTSSCIASVSVMMASMYCGQMRTNDHDNTNNEMLDVVETRLLAMERISVLFERIRKGNRWEACVIGKVLSLSLGDFVSTQDMVNKTIAELLSSVQPYPDIIAYVVFEVFQSLHNNDQSNLVSEWVLLSLGNSLQRTPLSKAVWCLTLLFATSSNDHFIVSLVPRIVAREKHFGGLQDWKLFCKCAVDFYTSQLNEELDRKSFQSVFTATRTDQSSNNNDEICPYKLLLDCIADINGSHGILQ